MAVARYESHSDHDLLAALVNYAYDMETTATDPDPKRRHARALLPLARRIAAITSVARELPWADGAYEAGPTAAAGKE